MKSFLLKIAPAIANIDGGCPSCIICFLASTYMIDSYDLKEVVDAINKVHPYDEINLKYVEKHIENLKFNKEFDKYD